MGQDFERDLNDDGDEELVDKADDFLDDLNKFGDTIAKAVADARTAVETKNEMDDADGVKKKQKQQSTDGGGDSMSDDELLEKIDKGFNKLIAIKGPDTTLKEAQEFIDNNEDMVRNFI
jgi:hypothetical protein